MTEIFRTPDERFENLPDFDFAPSYAQVEDLRIAYLDIGAGDPVICFQGATTTELSPEIVAAYEAPFPTPESKAGAAQFPLLVPISEDYDGATEMAHVMDELSRWDKPALIAFSDSDPVFPSPKSGQVFCD